MALDDKSSLPSYHQAVNGPSSVTLTHAERIRAVQSTRVAQLLVAHVDPLIQHQTQAGLAKSTFILVPSDVTPLQATRPSAASKIIEKLPGADPRDDRHDQLLGFPDDELVRLIRLDDPIETSTFWHQPAVVRDLEAALRKHLGILPPPPPSPTSPPAQSALERRGFWRRKSSGVPSSPWDSRAVSSRGTWSVKGGADASLAPGQMAAFVSVEEVSVRTLSEFDLFEVCSGRALVVKIRFGS